MKMNLAFVCVKKFIFTSNFQLNKTWREARGKTSVLEKIVCQMERTAAFFHSRGRIQSQSRSWQCVKWGWDGHAKFVLPHRRFVWGHEYPTSLNVFQIFRNDKQFKDCHCIVIEIVLSILFQDFLFWVVNTSHDFTRPHNPQTQRWLWCRVRSPPWAHIHRLVVFVICPIFGALPTTTKRRSPTKKHTKTSLSSRAHRAAWLFDQPFISFD